MSGFDASSTERCSGLVDVRVDVDGSGNADAVAIVVACVGAFLESIHAGYFFPGAAHAVPSVRVETGAVEGRIDVSGLPLAAFAVLAGMLDDARRHRDVALTSALAIAQGASIDLLVETGVRPAAPPRPPFAVDLPESLDGNDTLLVELRFAEPVDPVIGERLLDVLGLWEMLSIAYPLDAEDPTEFGGAQRHFNDPSTIHHHEWVWVNVDPLAWNLLINLACAWHRTLPVERLHIE